jgi:hypothetical protein
MQVEAMQSYIKARGWELARQIKDVGSGAKDRAGRETLLSRWPEVFAQTNPERSLPCQGTAGIAGFSSWRCRRLTLRTLIWL